MLQRECYYGLGVIILRGVPGSHYGTVKRSRSLTSEAATIHKACVLDSPPQDDSAARGRREWAARRVETTLKRPTVLVLFCTVKEQT